MPGLLLHVAASPGATWLAVFSRGSLNCLPRAGEMGAKEGGSMAGTVTIMQAAFHSVSLPHTQACTHAADFSYWTYPCSLNGSSLSTPMGSGVRSSVPSSVKPAVSSMTYFSHSAAALEQCLGRILV